MATQGVVNCPGPVATRGDRDKTKERRKSQVVEPVRAFKPKQTHLLRHGKEAGKFLDIQTQHWPCMGTFGIKVCRGHGKALGFGEPEPITIPNPL